MCVAQVLDPLSQTSPYLLNFFREKNKWSHLDCLLEWALMIANQRNSALVSYNNERNVFAAHEIQGTLRNQGAGRRAKEQVPGLLEPEAQIPLGCPPMFPLLLWGCWLHASLSLQSSSFHAAPAQCLSHSAILTCLFVFLLAFCLFSRTIKFFEKKDLIHLLISKSLASNTVAGAEKVHSKY